MKLLTRQAPRLLAALALGTTLAFGAQAMPETVPADPLSREAVRDALAHARATNRLTPPGEIGDTAEVLSQRETFNALQAEVLTEEAERQALAAPREPVALTVGQLFQLMDRAAAEGRTVVLVVDDTESPR